MAEVAAFRNNVLPYPIHAVPYAVVFPMLDADGDLVTGATTPDAEVSKNGDTFADCTNESVEIPTNSGMYYLLLTAAEMNANVVAVIAKSATAGMKTTALVLYPRVMVQLRAGTAAGGGSNTITLDAGASAVDDYYNNCICVAVIDGVTEVRLVIDYVGSTKVMTVHPGFSTASPDSDDTFAIYLPDGRQITQADQVAAGGIAGTYSAGIPEVKVNNIAANAITATSIASDAITAAKIAADALSNAKFADGALTAAKFAAGAFDAVWSVAARLLTAGTNIVLAKGTGVTGFNDLSAAQVNAEADTAIADAALATAASLTTVAGFLDTEIAAILADTNELQTDLVDGGRLDLLVDAIKTKTDGLPSDPADASVVAGLIAAVETKVDTVDTVADAIKAKTDSLNFGVTGKVDANVTHVNEAEVSGDGAPGTEWGPV